MKKITLSFLFMILFLSSAFPVTYGKSKSLNKTRLILSLSNPHPPFKTPAAVTVTVTAKNIGNQNLEVTLSNSDTTGITTLSSFSLILTKTAPSASTTLNYNGGKIPLPGITITATAPGLSSASTYFMPEGEPFIINVRKHPYGIAIAANGDIWVTSYSRLNASCPTPFFWSPPGITEISPSGAVLRVISPTWLHCQYAGIAVDASGNLWVTEDIAGAVAKLSPSGKTLGTYHVGNFPHGIAIDASENIWVANQNGSNVVKLSPSGKILGRFPVGKSPRNLAIDASGNVWVTNHDSGSVTELSSNGATLGTFKVRMWPDGITIDPEGNIWVTNFGSMDVTELSSTGTILGTFKTGLRPHRVAVDDSGNIWVAQLGSNISRPSNSLSSAFFAPAEDYLISGNNLIKFNSSGAPLGSVFAGTEPVGIAIDQYGNIWLTNRLTNTVSVISGAASSQEFFPYRNHCQSPCHSSQSAPQWPF